MKKLLFALLFTVATQQAASGMPPTATRAVTPPRSAAPAKARAASPAVVRTRRAPEAPRNKRARSHVARPEAFETFDNGMTLRVVNRRDLLRGEHRDPNKSGNRLLDVSGRNRDKKVSKNFKVGEYAQSGNKTFTHARIDKGLARCLQSIRDLAGRPVMIRSGYRSDWYNLELYRRMGKRATKSQHISGRAADIMIPGMTGRETAMAAVDACGTNVAIGIGIDFAHVDVRGDFRVWSYKGVGAQQRTELEKYRWSKVLAQKRREQKPRAGGRSKRV